MTILGLDPSYRAFGYSVFNIVDGAEVLHATGLIETGRESKRRNISVSDDDMRRAHTLASQLFYVIRAYNVVGVAWEIPGGSQNANSAKGLGIVKGIMAATSLAFPEILFQGVSPDDVKAATAGAGATKTQIFEFVQKRYPYFERWPRDGRGKQLKILGRLEHVADSIGTVLALLRSGEPSARTMLQRANVEEESVL